MDIEDRLDILADAAKYDVSFKRLIAAQSARRPGECLLQRHLSQLDGGRALHFTAEDPDDEFLHL